jgi:hypothetical protein
MDRVVVEIIKKQDEQWTYNVKMKRVRATIVAIEKHYYIL